MMNSDLEFHAFCLTDTGSRLDQFAAAIAARITPGDTVVDLGAGSGILSFLACRAGARRVYAVEAGESLEFARLLAARNGFADRSEFVGKASTHVILPERVDAIVGDIHDTFGLQAHGGGGGHRRTGPLAEAGRRPHPMPHRAEGRARRSD